jgi:ABC-type transporter Mla subunit MlaD
MAMKRMLLGLIGIGALVAIAAVGVVVSSLSRGSSGQKVNIVLDNAFGISQGGDLRISGVRAGTTTGFHLSNDDPPKAVVEAEINQPGLDSLRTDANCQVRQQSLIGEYYVDCQPGQSPNKLPDGGTVPVTQTASTIPVDLINDVMRKPYRERFSIIVNELGAGLAGRPAELSQVLHRADPGLRETSQTLQILGRENQVIKDFITNSDQVIGQLNQRRADVAGFFTTSANTAKDSAAARDQLSASLQKLPPYLDELRPTMQSLSRLSDAQVPMLQDMQRAAPSLDRLFTEQQPFAQASRPALRSLGDTATHGSETINASQGDINELRRLSDQAPGFAKPLRQMLQSIDDRSKSTEPTPLAKELAPPAPDKTSASHGQGLTGFESLANYFYQQTLAINGFDQIGHVLRVFSVTNNCGNYVANPTPQQIHDCNAWLGPHQPGVNAPDPTGNGGSSQSAPVPGLPGLQSSQPPLQPPGSNQPPPLPQAPLGQSPSAPPPPAPSPESNPGMLNYLLAP